MQALNGLVLCEQTGQLESLLTKFTAEEERQMKRMLQRVDLLANVRNSLKANAIHQPDCDQSSGSWKTIMILLWFCSPACPR